MPNLEEAPVPVQEWLAKQTWSFFAVNDRNYESLTKNMADITRWVKEAVWRLSFYTKQLETTVDKGETGNDERDTVD